jgi:hypothetical protein
MSSNFGCSGSSNADSNAACICIDKILRRVALSPVVHSWRLVVACPLVQAVRASQRPLEHRGIMAWLSN